MPTMKLQTHDLLRRSYQLPKSIGNLLCGLQHCACALCHKKKKSSSIETHKPVVSDAVYSNAIAQPNEATPRQNEHTETAK